MCVCGFQPVVGQGKKGNKRCVHSAIVLENVSKRHKKEINNFLK